jgi:ribosomal protein S17
MLRDYAYRLKTGTVVSVGRMQRTVTVLHRHTVWDKHIRKYYPKETRYLVSDPRESLREGDVIEFSSGAPKSRHVHHVVERIITPFAVPIEDRPAVMSREERQAERERRWAEKYVLKESRRLGQEVDLAALVQTEEGETLSASEMIHRLHGGKERVGKVKALVERRLAERASQESDL